MILVALSLMLHSEALVIISNVVLALATMLLFYATAQADRHMVGQMHKDDMGVLKKIISLLTKKSDDPN